MRWIVLSLVLINLMIFTWRYIDRQAPFKHELHVDDVALPGDGLKGAASSGSASHDNTATNKVRVEQSALAQQTITLLEELENNKVALRDEAFLEPVSLAKGEPLGNTQTAMALDVEPNTQEQAEDSCYWIGPMPDEVSREELRRRFEEFNISSQERAIDVSGGWRYWVYLEPKADRAEAASQLAVLKKMDIDSYLILKGERKNGVSLGLFSRKELADAKMSQMQKKGWQPKMDTFERSVKQWWVTLPRRDIERIGDGVLAILLKNKPEMQINEKKCK